MMQLGDLLSGIEVLSVDDENVAVENLSYFVQMIKPGWVYVACDTPWMQGHRAIQEALDRGAAVVVVEKADYIPRQAERSTVIVPDSKKAYSLMCANFFGHADRHLALYAVTGTKGKTTMCHLLESIFRNAGLRTGLIGTIVRRIGDREIPSGSTTPEPYELHWLIQEMYTRGVTHVILETSSIGIVEDRIWGLRFDGMVFTNLGHDHLAYHGGLENYQKAKSRLFTEYASAEGKRPACAINIDDSFGTYLATIAEGEIVTYGLKNGDVCGSGITFSASGIEGKVGEIPIRSSLLGAHNIYNILGAIALSRKMGIASEPIANGISHLCSIPGRLERVDNESGIEAFVDYAHTPESVLATLVTLKETFSGRRVVAIIGCGGGRDRSKRPVMARIAVENSDVCIFTSDNPRHEDPMAILVDMLNGVNADELIEKGRLKVIVDRQEAIYRGVEIAKDGGVLVVLGKGHERFQIIGGKGIPFDDREVAAEALRSQAKGNRSASAQ